jgi:hypothetical protein
MRDGLVGSAFICGYNKTEAGTYEFDPWWGNSERRIIRSELWESLFLRGDSGCVDWQQGIFEVYFKRGNHDALVTLSGVQFDRLRAEQLIEHHRKLLDPSSPPAVFVPEMPRLQQSLMDRINFISAEERLGFIRKFPGDVKQGWKTFRGIHGDRTGKHRDFELAWNQEKKRKSGRPKILQ